METVWRIGFGGFSEGYQVVVFVLYYGIFVYTKDVRQLSISRSYFW